MGGRAAAPSQGDTPGPADYAPAGCGDSRLRDAPAYSLGARHGARHSLRHNTARRKTRHMKRTMHEAQEARGARGARGARCAIRRGTGGGSPRFVQRLAISQHPRGPPASQPAAANPPAAGKAAQCKKDDSLR